MADLADITAYLAGAAAAAIYPNGFTQPSIAAMDVRIFEGWPQPDQLDLDVAGQMLSSGIPPRQVPRPNGPAANVSVYPQPGATATPFQILDNTYIIVRPGYGINVLSASSAGVITVAGQPNAGEYLTVVADRSHVYSRTGANTAAILAALAADAVADYPSASATATTLTIPFAYQMQVRQGAVGVMGKVSHRQRQQIMITTWAPNHRSRDKIAAAIDNALKQVIVATMPDTTQAKFLFRRNQQTDQEALQTIYRRDLIYEAEYATLTQFPGYVVTSLNAPIQAGNWSLSEQVPPIATMVTDIAGLFIPSPASLTITPQIPTKS